MAFRLSSFFKSCISGCVFACVASMLSLHFLSQIIILCHNSVRVVDLLIELVRYWMLDLWIYWIEIGCRIIGYGVLDFG